MPNNLVKTVVVITGASSGIGRAAALEFAQRGASMVLVARGQAGLDEAAAGCRELGARVLTAAADVAQEDAVESVARKAEQEFGRIDVWVNDASVAAFGHFLDVPSDAFRRVIETNLFGVVHGSRAALTRFQRQRRGVLINVASVLGKEGIPYLSAYVTAKEAVIGLSACLREELEGAEDIHVCTILPASIDTPIWQHGANYTGHGIRPIPPVYSTEDVAGTIVSCAEKPRRIVYVGGAGRLVTMAHKISPGIYERLAVPIVEATMIKNENAAVSEGNLFRPSVGVSVHGGWHSHARTGLRRAAMIAAGAAIPALVGWYYARAA